MDTIPFSVIEAYADFNTASSLLQQSIYYGDRSNIIRACSHISYIVGDILEQVVPDGYSVTISNIDK